MGYYDILADNFTSTARMAVEKETSLEAGCHLISACRAIVWDYSFSLNNLDETDDELISYTVIDLVAYLDEKDLMIDYRELGKMLMCDKRLSEFLGEMINGGTKYQSSWESLSFKKKEAIIQAYQMAENYYNFLTQT